MTYQRQLLAPLDDAVVGEYVLALADKSGPRSRTGDLSTASANRVAAIAATRIELDSVFERVDREVSACAVDVGWTITRMTALLTDAAAAAARSE